MKAACSFESLQRIFWLPVVATQKKAVLMLSMIIICMYFFHKTITVKESSPSEADNHFSVGQ